MELFARLTKDATVRELTDGRKVVQFSVAINDSFKPKGGQPTRITTYFDCSYWKSPGIAQYLTKASWVELSGRVGIREWKDKEGNSRSSLRFHCNEIRLRGGNKKVAPLAEPAPATAELADDLPF